MLEEKLHTVVGTRAGRVIYNTSGFLIEDDVLAVVSNLQSRGRHCRLDGRSWGESEGSKGIKPVVLKFGNQWG